MAHRCLIAGLLLTLAAFAAPAQERDILDAALEHPLGTTINGQPVRFGELPTSSLGDLQLGRRVDFTVAVRSDGQPLAGTEVEFEELGLKRTDATGSVQLHQQIWADPRMLQWGTRFTVHAEGFASEAWVGGVAFGTTTKVVELERESVQRGRVVDAGGRALANFVVQAHAVEPDYDQLHDPLPDEKSGTARADDTGAFALHGLHGGRQYRLVVISADGAMTDGERVVTAGGAAVDIVVPAAVSGSSKEKP